VVVGLELAAVDENTVPMLTADAGEMHAAPLAAKVGEQLKETEEFQRFVHFRWRVEDAQREIACREGSIQEIQGSKQRLANSAKPAPDWASEMRAFDVELESHRETLAEVKADYAKWADGLRGAFEAAERKAQELATEGGHLIRKEIESRRDSLLAQLATLAGPVLDQLIREQKALEIAMGGNVAQNRLHGLVERLGGEALGSTTAADMVPEAPTVTIPEAAPAPEAVPTNSEPAPMTALAKVLASG